jgi:hypothetical protein
MECPSLALESFFSPEDPVGVAISYNFAWKIEPAYILYPTALVEDSGQHEQSSSPRDLMFSNLLRQRVSGFQTNTSNVATANQ